MTWLIFRSSAHAAMRPTKNFVDRIEAIKPAAIIGASTGAKAFNQQVIEAMTTINQRPIIFQYSNPKFQWMFRRAGFPLVGRPSSFCE